MTQSCLTAHRHLSIHEHMPQHGSGPEPDILSSVFVSCCLVLSVLPQTPLRYSYNSSFCNIADCHAVFTIYTYPAPAPTFDPVFTTVSAFSSALNALHAVIVVQNLNMNDCRSSAFSFTTASFFSLKPFSFCYYY